jgi:alkaline phosphatase D
MGRARHPRLARRGLTRRNFLRSAGAVSALIGAQPFLAGAQDDEVSDIPAAPDAGVFHHGVASGDPLSDRVILWTRVSRQSAPDSFDVDYVVATDRALTTVVASGTAAAARAADYTVKVDVTGLSPDTTYYYRFTSALAHSPIGRTRTLPVGSVSHLRIAVVTCASLAQGYFNAYRRVSERPDLDLVVHLGDYIYEHGDGEYGNTRTYRPPHEIISLRDYRTRHNQYKTDADLQALHRQHPVVAIWDDHEFADNAWTGGAANHQPGSEGPWADRVASAMRAYYEWMPIRPVSADHKKIFRSFRLGDLVELFMLEERLTARDKPVDPNLTDNPPLFEETGEFRDKSRHMISDGQQRWLVEGLRQSPAQWKLVGQGVMLAPARVGKTIGGHNTFFNPDQWDGYKPARDRLLGAIAGPGSTPAVPNTVVLTGDIHSSWAADLPRNPYGADYDGTTGDGSLAVEFVATSVTSPGLADYGGQGASGLLALNPHLKYVELTRHGYLLLDVTPPRVSGEWWYVDAIDTPSAGESLGVALQTAKDSNRITPGAQSPSKDGAPPLAS